LGVIEVGAQHEGVDEKPDQVFEFGAVASGGDGAHGDIGLPGPAAQQQLAGRHQRHEQGAVVAAAELFEPGGDRGGHHEVWGGAGGRLGQGASVGGGVSRGRGGGAWAGANGVRACGVRRWSRALSRSWSGSALICSTGNSTSPGGWMSWMPAPSTASKLVRSD